MNRRSFIKTLSAIPIVGLFAAPVVFARDRYNIVCGGKGLLGVPRYEVNGDCGGKRYELHSGVVNEELEIRGGLCGSTRDRMNSNGIHIGFGPYRTPDSAIEFEAKF